MSAILVPLGVAGLDYSKRLIAGFAPLMAAKKSVIRAQKCELAAVLAAEAGGILAFNDIRGPGIREDMLHRSTIRTLAGAILCASLVACDSEPPARSVSEFMENPILLEAAVVRCAQNRTESRYDLECMNAREAVKIIEAREEASRRADLEAESERKRKALRRTQQAAAEARRRAEEERRRREEAAYLAQFGETPPPDTAATGMVDSNAPVAVLPEPPPAGAAEPIESPYDDPSYAAPAPASTAAPGVEPQPETAPEPTDLDAIREELKRRSDQDGS